MACHEGRKAHAVQPQQTFDDYFPSEHRSATMPFRTPVKPPHPADMDSVLQ